MSANDVMKTMDPRLDLTRGSKMVLEESARVVSLVKRTATSSTTSGVEFDNIDPGSTGFLVDKKLYIRAGFRIGFTPRDGANTLRLNAATAEQAALSINKALSILGIGITNGFRAFPISQASKSAELVLNGETFNVRLNDFVEPLMRYDNDYIRAKNDYSMTAGYQDITFDPKNHVGVRQYVPPPAIPQLIAEFDPYRAGLNGSPFAGYGDNTTIVPRGYYLPSIRAVYPADVVLQPGGGVNRTADPINLGPWTITFIATGDGATNNVIAIDTITLNEPRFFTEPLMIPLLDFGCNQDKRGLYGVNDMRVSLTYDGQLIHKIYEGTPSQFSSAATAAGPNPDDNGFFAAVADVSLAPSILSVGESSQTMLYFNRLTPKIYPQLPSSNIYSDMRIKPLDKEFTIQYLGTDVLSQPTTITYSNLTAGTIPKRVYIYCSKNNKTYLDSDHYATIEQLQFNFNNQNSQFNGADIEQLYLMCKRNGLMMELPQFQHHSGSVLCLDFARDISLNDGDYPGRIGNYNFEVQVTCRARRAKQTNAPLAAGNESYKLHIVTLEEGYAVVQNQICSRVGGLIQIDTTKVPLRVVSKDQYWENIYGGAFIDDLKHVAHKAVKFGQKALPYVQKGAEAVIKHGPTIAKGLATILPMLAAGAGMSESEAERLVGMYGVDGFMERYGGSVEAGKSKLKKKARGGRMTTKSEMAGYLGETF